MSFSYRFFISLFINGFFSVCASSHDIYFDTHFLSQPQQVRAHLLKKEGFSEGFFSELVMDSTNCIIVAKPRCSWLCPCEYFITEE